MAPTLQRPVGGARADIDDHAAALFDHDRQGRAHTEIHALEVGIDGGRPFVRVGFRHAAERLDDPGIVDEDVEGSEPGTAGLDRIRQVPVAGYVAGYGKGIPAEFVRQCPAFVERAGGEHDPCAGSGERPGRRRTDPRLAPVTIAALPATPPISAPPFLPVPTATASAGCAGMYRRPPQLCIRGTVRPYDIGRFRTDCRNPGWGSSVGRGYSADTGRVAGRMLSGGRRRRRRRGRGNICDIFRRYLRRRKTGPLSIQPQGDADGGLW